MGAADSPVMADETPAQVVDAGLGDWYTGLSSQDRVRVRRYVEGIDTSSPLGFLTDLMSRAVEDHNYKLAVTAGRYLEGADLGDAERFEATEGLIEGLFGSDAYDEARAMCLRNLDLYPRVSAELFPSGAPERLSCRNRLIDIMVGVEGDYDGAIAMLDRYLDMGLIDESERDYRRQSLKVHRMQRTFDNIFNYRRTERCPSGPADRPPMGSDRSASGTVRGAPGRSRRAPCALIIEQCISESMKKVDTGGLSFSDLRDEGKYYVDKSLLIKDILDTNERGVYLFTRPRRFGKTTNITMLDAFFNIEYAGNNWFDGLEISEHHEYDRFRNAYPVIFLRLSTLSFDSFEEFMSSLRSVLVEEYERHGFIFEPGFMTAGERNLYESMSDNTAPPSKVARGVLALCRMMNRHYGRKAVILIDEYDQAITNSFGRDHQERIADFTGRMMNASVKENPYRQLVYITGATQVAKAGFFTGANNLWIDNIFNTKSGERFGFTESEVRDALSYYGRPERFDEVRSWYDGYRFGDAEVYNPFSFMMYISKGFVPDSYWEHSGRNLPMGWMLQRADSIGFGTVSDLINGESVTETLHQSMSYEELRLSNTVDMFSLMAMTGYLNAFPNGDGTYDISIPNREVAGIVESMLALNRRVGDDLFVRFNSAVLDGDADAMVDALQEVLADGSYFDFTEEAHYGIVILTMLHGILRGYRVTAQKESGNGRVDLILEPRDAGTVPIIFELKVSDTEDALDRDAEAAIRQIHDRRYYPGMKGDVVLIGMSFFGKIVRGKVERFSPRWDVLTGHHVRGRRPSRGPWG